jgi:predicted metal-binding membrane protein
MSAAMQDSQTMAGMGMSMDMPWTITDAAYTFVMWAVMMLAMMTPSAAPVILLFAGMQRNKGGGRFSLTLFIFVSGWDICWCGRGSAPRLRPRSGCSIRPRCFRRR